MTCYITGTSSFLPGEPVDNDNIEKYLGVLPGEAEIKSTVLGMNGILTRHYAQDQDLKATHDVYDMARHAVLRCVDSSDLSVPITMLTSGTTYSPLLAPGTASILHSRISDIPATNHPMEISSHGGVCSSATAALVNAIRAVSLGAHRKALCVGVDHPSEILKVGEIDPIDDRHEHAQLRHTKWFMTVFLRFMLSDGAGAMLVQDRPSKNGLSLRVNWTHSMSFANQSELCMKLEPKTARLSQDSVILSRYLFSCGEVFLQKALEANNDSFDDHQIVLPHLSSHFFRKKVERSIKKLSKDPDNPLPYWTNLSTAGNTGAASIYIMLDHFVRRGEIRNGDRILLFVPESGQFNFVMISLTAVIP